MESAERLEAWNWLKGEEAETGDSSTPEKWKEKCKYEMEKGRF